MSATRRPLPPKRLYLDSSALVKLVVPEPETNALRRLLRLWPRRSTSALAAVEVPRAARRHSNDAPVARRAEAVLAQVGRIAISREILAQAAELEPASIRSLDAIHLASALTLGRDLGALVTYDADLEKAARALRIDVLSPS